MVATSTQIRPSQGVPDPDIGGARPVGPQQPVTGGVATSEKKPLTPAQENAARAMATPGERPVGSSLMARANVAKTTPMTSERLGQIYNGAPDKIENRIFTGVKSASDIDALIQVAVGKGHPAEDQKKAIAILNALPGVFGDKDGIFTARHIDAFISHPTLSAALKNASAYNSGLFTQGHLMKMVQKHREAVDLVNPHPGGDARAGARNRQLIPQRRALENSLANLAGKQAGLFSLPFGSKERETVFRTVAQWVAQENKAHNFSGPGHRIHDALVTAHPTVKSELDGYR